MQNAQVRAVTKIGCFFLLIASLFYTQINFAQTPDITNGTPADSFLGESFCFDASFSNSAGAPGFAPYIRLVIPDGLSFDSATIFGGNAIATNVGTFLAPPDNVLTDPLIDQMVTGPESGQLIIIQLPLGSVIASGPDLSTEICLTIDPDAPIGIPLDVVVQPVFQLGDTATGANGPIIGTADTQSVTPTVITFEKSNNAPESERPPGPSWPFNFSLTVDIANTAVINPINITDQLPANLQFVGPVNITGGSGCSVVTEPVIGASGGNLSVSCTGNTIGNTSASDVVVSYSAFITDTLDETVCSASTLTNNATLNATYNPSIGAPLVLPPSDDDSMVSTQHVELQKSVSAGLVTPGDTVTYTLNLQVTDFDDVNNLILTDILPDGTQFVAHGSLNIAGANIAIIPNITPNGDGTTTVVYDVTAVSGNIPAGSSITLNFDALVLQALNNALPLLANDNVTNRVTATYGLVSGAAACTDDGAATSVIVPVELSKTIVNPQAFYSPGDVVTFRLSLAIQSGDTNDIGFIDSLPLPVFNVADIDTVFGNDIRLSPTDTLGLTPVSIIPDAGGNSITINWPNVSTSQPQILSVDIDALIDDSPFADDLFLTNLLIANTSNSSGMAATDVSPSMLQVGAPELVLTKGVSAVDNASANITPAVSILPIDGDVTNADANDSVSFAITVENIGSASAFQVQISDPQITGLDSCSVDNVVNGNGAVLGFTGDIQIANGIQLDDPLDGNLGTAGSPFGGETAIVTLTCTIAASTQPNSIISNNAQAIWASSATTTFFFPAVEDDAQIVTSSPTITKRLIDIQPGVASTPPFNNQARRQVHIGEVLTYQVDINIPEGTTQNVTFVDLLDTGLSLLDVTSITPSGSVTSDFPGGFAGVLASAVVSNVGGQPQGVARRLTLDFDNVSNADTDNTATESISVVYRAVVINWDNNDRGDNRNNRADWNFDNPNGGASRIRARAPNVQIAEPELQIEKSITPASGDAGDVFTVNLLLDHSPASNSDSFDVVLSDQLPADMIFVPSSLVLGTCPTPPDTVPTQVAGFISASWTNFPEGSSCEIVFEVSLPNTVNPGSVIQNCANTTWESLEESVEISPLGSSPLASERTGDVIDIGGSANIYNDEDCATISVSDVTIEKQVIASNQTHTGNGSSDPTLADLTIGEQVTFQLAVSIPEGTIPQLIIQDNLPALPATLGVISAGVSAIGNNLDAVSVAPVISDMQLGDGIDDTVVFDFGGPINNNPADGVINDDDRIFIEVVAVVINQPSNNASGLQGTNAALVQFGPGLNGSDTINVDIVEPLLSITKQTNITSADAGDVINFSLTVEHLTSSTAAAQDVSLTDLLPPGLSFLANLQLGGCTDIPDIGPTESAGQITASWTQLDLGASCEITFDVVLDNSVVPGEILTNQANIAWDSLDSLAGDFSEQRSYLADDQVSITVTEPGLEKVVIETSVIETEFDSKGSAPDLTIGELVTYQITATFIDGTSPASMVFDQMPNTDSVLSVVSSEISFIGSDISIGSGLVVGAAGDDCLPNCDADSDTFRDQVLWDLGDVLNIGDTNPDPNPNDTIVFEVVAIVVNQANNQGQPGVDANQLNQATLSTADQLFFASTPVDIVAPVLSITKDVITPSMMLVDPFQVDGATPNLRFRLFIEHTSDSTAAAFDLAITDVLSAETFWVNDSSVISSCVGLNIDASPAPGSSGTLMFSIPVLDSNDINCEITYEVDINNAIPLPGSFVNSVALDWNSIQGGGSENRAGASMETGTLVTVNDGFISKSVTSTSVAETGAGQGTDIGDDLLMDVAIGELITYNITIGFSEGTTSNVVITDTTVAGQIELIGASVLSISDDMMTTLPGVAVISPSNVAVFDFGDVTNGIDQPSGDNDLITIQVFARVIDIPTNINDVNLLNSSTFTFTGGSGTAEAQVNVVEPDIELSKTMGPIIDNAVLISLTATNNGNAPAFDMSFSDDFDETIWVSSSAVADNIAPGFALSQTSLIGVTNVTINQTGDPSLPSPDQVLDPGESLTVSFFVTVLGGHQPPVNTLLNTADITYSSLPGVDPTERDYTDDDDANLGIPNLMISKTWTGPNNPAEPGDTITFTITTINNGTAAATDISVSDTPDVIGSFQQGTVNAPGGMVITGNTAADASVLATFPSIPANGNVQVSYQVVIPNPFPANTTQQLVNQATVDSAELVEGVSNDPTTTDDDDPTVVAIAADPVLSISKTDGGVSVMPGDAIDYVITFQNIGNQNTTGVVITETVPVNTIFNVTNSTVGWSCANASPAGINCNFSIGNLDVGASASVTFSVIVENPLAAGIDNINNSVSITDDGSHSDNGLPVTDTGGDTTPIIAAPDLSLTKDDGGSTAIPGGVVAYTLAFANVGNQDATGVVITETVPLNSIFNSGSSTAGWTCVPDASSGSSCTLAIGNVAAGDNGNALFAITIDNPLPSGVTDITNTASIADDGNNGADPTPDDNTDNDNTPVDAAPDMVISKDDAGVSTVPGGIVTYLLSFQNVGNQNATGVVITDSVPANSSFSAGNSTAGWLCVPDINAGSNCTITIGAVAGAGGNGSVNFAVTVDNPLPAGVDMLINNASIADDGTNGTDPTPTNNTSGDTTPLDAAPDLSISKDDGGATTTPGGSISYTLNYQNTGNQDATGVSIIETVPENSTFDALNSSAGWSCIPDGAAGSTCTLLIGDLAAGVNGTSVFAVVVDNPLPAGVDEINNTASIADDGSNGADPTPDDNMDSDNTTVDAAPDLSLTKDDGGTTSTAGGTVSYTLSYTNTGNQDATGVGITETVPDNTVFDPINSALGWLCLPDNNAGSICEFDIGDLAVGATGSTSFVVLVDDPLAAGVTEITNTASIADDGNNGADPTPDDNTDDDTTEIIAVPDLAITKDDGGVVGMPGQPIVYTLTYDNLGNQDATGVVITETVPVGSTFSSVDSLPSVWSCAGASPAGTTCTVTIGDLPAGAGGTETFAIIVDDTLPEGQSTIINTVSIADDGNNGVDSNPDNDTDTIETIAILQPPVGVKLGEVIPNSDRILWTLIWFNPNNINALPVLILDDIPIDTSYVEGTVACSPDGASSCDASFNLLDNRIEASGIVASDFSAPIDSGPDDLNNEIIIRFETRINRSGLFVIENQAEGCYDENNNGDPIDDIDGGLVCPVTDDPNTGPTGDPTVVTIVIPVPTLSTTGMMILLLLLAALSRRYFRVRYKTR